MKNSVPILATSTPCLSDLAQIFALYRAVAEIPGALARSAGEIDENLVRHNLAASLERGITRVVRADDRIVGEIHAYRPVPAVFSHVLSDLTIAVDPQF